MARPVMTDTEVEGVRDQICDAAQTLFAEKGVDNVGLRTIGAKLDLSATALYRYFPEGRDEILAAVRARAFKQFADVTEEAFQSAGSPLDRFRAMGKAHVAFARDNTTTYHMMFDFAQSGEFPELRKQAKRARDILFAAIEEVAQSEVVDEDTRVLSHVAWAAMHGAVLLETSNQLKFGVNIDQVMDGLSHVLFGHPKEQIILRKRKRRHPMKRILILVLMLCAPMVGAETIAYKFWFGELGSGLISSGASEKQVTNVMNRITNMDPYNSEPGSWTYEFAVPARTYQARAESAEVDGDLDVALKNYQLAYAYFNASRWPALYSPEREASYQKQLDCFFKIAQIRNFDIEIVEIPYEGKTIIGNLYKRPGAPAPVLVWSGGLDGWKDGSLDFKQELMDAGFSVFCVDLPGTGQSQWPLEATSERIYSRIADYLKTRKDVDGSKLAAYFGSFSGVYAVKLALKDSDYSASVNHSGGVHAFFHPPVRMLPPLSTTMGMRACATIHAMGIPGLSFDNVRPIFPVVDDVLDTFSTFSLKEQGYLQPHANQAPLLTIHGTEDALMPVSDVHLMTESGIKQDTLIYEGDGHMAWEHASDHQPKMIAWLQEKLGVK